MSKITVISVDIDELEERIAKRIQQFIDKKEETPQATTKKYFTRKEVSQLLHISLPTLHKLTLQGKIKASRIGRRVLYEEAEVEHALNEIKGTL